ncbi:MAG: hypothetical protein ABSE43_12520 [Steroidobacteraceae bacterium]|jgi:hypothetical protein
MQQLATLNPQPADSTAPARPGATLLPSVPASHAMDREFIERNQIVERYLAGRLPLKGAQDFEVFCRQNPHLLDELGLAGRVHQGLRLLEAGGIALPWEPEPPAWWAKLPFFIGLALAAAGFGILALVLDGRLAQRSHALAVAQQRILDQPLEPATSTGQFPIVPSRTAPSRNPVAVVGGSQTQMADFKIDMSWSKYTAYRVSIDRIDQGRVEVLYNQLRDSNGIVRLALNSSALGPGDYQITLEGLTLYGDVIPQAWTTIGIRH